MKSRRYWLKRTINTQQKHIEILKDNIEILKTNLDLEKSFRKYYQRKIERVNNGY